MRENTFISIVASIPILAVIIFFPGHHFSKAGTGGNSTIHMIKPMETEQNKIENLRAKYDSLLMSIDGVVSVGTGLGKTGRPCLLIGTSLPMEQIRKKLPKELFQVDVELQDMGTIHSQDEE
jgi:hypothetical protein